MSHYFFIFINLYRYGFNGKENDDEVSGNGNQYDYGFRIYNPRLGRFLSIDPLTKSYPMLTPYQFSSNSPIDGVDLDGLEYVSANEVRIKMIKGEVHLNIDNFNLTTRRAWENRDLAVQGGYAEAPAGYLGGYPTKVGEVNLDGLVPDQVEGMDIEKQDYTPDVGFENIYRSTNFTSVKSSNNKLLQGEGTENENVYGVRSAVPSAGGRLAGTAAALNAITWAIEQVTIFSDANDRKKFDEHLSLLKVQVSKDLKAALEDHMIPPEYQTKENLAAISSVILSGTNPTTDKEIYRIGIDIVKKISKNYIGDLMQMHSLSNQESNLSPNDATKIDIKVNLPAEKP